MYIVHFVNNLMVHAVQWVCAPLYTRDVERDRQNAPQNSLLLGDLCHLLVDDVDAESVAGALELGDDVADGLDALHLLVEVVALQEVAEVGVALLPRLPVQVKQRLVHRLLELEGGLHGLEGAAPLHGSGLGDVLELDSATAAGLIFHQFHTVLALLVRALAEVGREPVQRLVIPVKPRTHGEVDEAGVELHVDLLVEQRLGVLGKVLANSGAHLDPESKLWAAVGRML